MEQTNQRKWWASLFVLCGVLGAMLGISVKTQDTIRHQTQQSESSQGYLMLKTQVQEQQRTIAALQKDNTRFANSESSNTQRITLLADDLNKAKLLAGLTDVQGPGLVVTLKDSEKRFPDAPLTVQMAGIIHDTDINQTVNELKAAGAEAISINGQRLVAISPVRCAGPTVYVNNTPQTPPYFVRAIGDPKTLETALNLPGGVADQLKQMDPAMISLKTSTHIVIPAYAGGNQPKYAHSVPVSEDSAKG